MLPASSPALRAATGGAAAANRWRQLVRDPAVEVGLRDRERLEAHVRVARAAVLDTRAVERFGADRVRA